MAGIIFFFKLMFLIDARTVYSFDFLFLCVVFFFFAFQMTNARVLLNQKLIKSPQQKTTSGKIR